MEKYGPALVVVGALLIAGLFAMDRYDSNFDPTGRKAAQDERDLNEAMQYVEEMAREREQRMNRLLGE